MCDTHATHLNRRPGAYGPRKRHGAPIDLRWLPCRAPAAALACAVVCATRLVAQTQAGETLSVVEAGPNHRVWASTAVMEDASGHPVISTNGYTEVCSGLNFWNPATEAWEPAVEAFELSREGYALALRGQTKLILAGNINSGGSVDIETPEGRRLLSNPMGLSLFDWASGRNVLLAEVKDCVGELTAPNEIVFNDCFDDVKGALVYRFTRQGVSQDVVLYSDPGNPADYGLDPETTRLEFYTEFIEAPEPERSVSAQGVPEDEELDFGGLALAPGVAYVLHEELETVPVSKRFQTLEDNRRFLIEGVPYPEVAPLLRRLEARVARPGPQTIANKLTASRSKTLAKLRPRIRTGSVELAAIVPGVTMTGPGLVLDYQTKSGAITNMVWAGDSTFFISGNVSLVGTNAIFESGAILKLTNGASITVNAPVKCEGTAYRQVVVTSMHDNSVGETISGSTGDPGAAYAGAVALDLGASAGNLEHLRVAHAQTAVGTSVGRTLRHIQLVHCQRGISATNADVSIHNALFHQVLTNFAGSSATLRVEHLTANTAAWLNSGQTLYLTNSLLVVVTNTGTYAGVGNQSTSSGTVFQSVGAGAHYLAAGSPYRNAAGSTLNINARLLAELRQLTTSPPIEQTSDFTASTVLSPQALRDTDQVDCGYHYCPIDYVWSSRNLTNATLVLTNGVAIGIYGPRGTTLQTGAKFISEGRPNALNRLVRYETVQEQSLVWGALTNKLSLLNVGSGNPEVRLRFTDVALMGGSNRRWLLPAGNQVVTPMAIQDSQLRGVQFDVYYTPSGISGTTFVFTNNIILKSALQFYQPNSGSYYPFTLTAFNNLFKQGSLNLTYDTAATVWTLKDNLFDCDSLSKSGSQTLTTGNNGYRSGLTSLGGSGNKTGLVPVYDAGILTNWLGVLGQFYYPATGGATSLTNLVNTGSRNSTDAGLYHFTTATNQVKEAATTVDIGFHYMAADASGLPLDYDGDGLPDYLEDRTGNGSYESSAGETNWQQSENGTTGVPGLQVFNGLE